METLPEDEIHARLAALPGWSLTAGGIRKTYAFSSFRKAIEFVNAVADAAETLQHHPDIYIRYREVTLTCISHDVGGVSERDFHLAARVEQIRG